ncbi:hypothetical protein ACFOWM_05595 [Ferruginibacter yonginensis]|uniref:DUF4142 domain-containing protein n=1 Tax=Ferruginibacter yonginensis TaxID=1310416 RepID=A0ABV8QTH5_9BACT
MRYKINTKLVGISLIIIVGIILCIATCNRNNNDVQLPIPVYIPNTDSSNQAIAHQIKPLQKSNLQSKIIVQQQYKKLQSHTIKTKQLAAQLATPPSLKVVDDTCSKEAITTYFNNTQAYLQYNTANELLADSIIQNLQTIIIKDDSIIQLKDQQIQQLNNAIDQTKQQLIFLNQQYQQLQQQQNKNHKHHKRKIAAAIIITAVTAMVLSK